MIKTSPQNQKYRDGWDAAFGDKPTKGEVAYDKWAKSVIPDTTSKTLKTIAEESLYGN
jgi:hypothetical protein